MENASKALLIAGAILIAILLIAIGMMVFNSASGVIDTASSSMTDQEKSIHNKKFTVYQGQKSGSVVKQLLSEVKTNNADGHSPKVKTVLDAASKTEAGKESSTEDGSSQIGETSIINVKTYNITTNTDGNGVVRAIYVDEVGKTTSGGGEA